jgi:VWFA-related protein
LAASDFTVFEEGVRQRITSVVKEDGPVNTVLLMEYGAFANYFYDTIMHAARTFVARAMGPRDYTAVAGYGTRPEVLTDFTRNRNELHEAFNAFRHASGYADSNLFDGLKFVLAGGETANDTWYAGLASVQGRKAVVVIGTGFDDFSRTSYDDVREYIAYSGVPIYTIGIGELQFLRAEPYIRPIDRVDFLQAQNTFRTLSEESGGRYYNVRFQGELEGIMQSIGAMLRNQYTITYAPAGRARPDKRQEIEIHVDVNGDGRPDNDDLDIQYRRYRLSRIS